MHLRRRHLAAAVLTVTMVASCSEGPSVPTSDPDGPLTVSGVEGSWRIEVPGTAACLPSLDAFVIRLDVSHSNLAGYLGVEGEEYFTGSWRVEPDGESFSLQGWVDMATRRFRFLLWQGVHVKGTVLSGRFVARTALTGWLAEPIPPGEGWAADPIPGYPGGFTVGSCEWPVEGSRLGG